MYDIPDSLQKGPFSLADARNAGMPVHRLRSRRFREIHRGVWVFTGYEMTHIDRLEAARKAMPDRARLSHISRLQALGEDVGPSTPYHFTVADDLHLAVPNIYLHRTKVMPALDDVGVTPCAAFIGHAAVGTVMSLIQIGDWLLRDEHMTLSELHDLSHGQLWRSGSKQALRIRPLLDGKSGSMPESAVRAMMTFCALPRPRANDVVTTRGQTRWADLWLPEWRIAIEYEGSQHQLDRNQYLRDIVRYNQFRSDGITYVQVTKELLDQPRGLMLHIYDHLVRQGYAGPAPQFGAMWRSLFRPPSTRLPASEVD